MIRRCFGWFALIALLSLVPYPVFAQDSAQRYESLGLGVAFDLPAGWQVIEGDNMLLAAAPADVPILQQGGVPAGWAVRMTFGTFNQLGITDATQLPGLLARLVSSEVSAPTAEAVQWGNASGYQAQVVMPNEGLTTRVALLAIAGGRVAIVRGFAPSAVWDSGAGAQFDALTQTLAFSLPKRDEDYINTIVHNDGGVLWQYISGQPSSGRVVMAGGITYDEFGVMYMAVGPGGVLALNQSTGYEVSYMGPWYEGNFVDIAIGPKDLKLYLANIKDSTDQAITVVDRAGNWTRAWGSRGDGDGQFAPGMPRTLTVTLDDSLWTVSEGHASGIRNRLYRFDLFGNLLQTVDLDTINPDLSGVRLDANPRTGALYLVGATGNLNVLDANGELLVVNLAAEILQDVTPVEITIAPDDNIILAIPAPGLDGYGFVELSVAGRLLDVFGFPFNTERGGAFLPGEYLNPAGLIVDTDGSIYWTETNPTTGYVQVQRFVFTGDGKLPLGAEMVADASAQSEIFGSSDPAKGGGSISYGQSVRGALNNRYPSHRWTFEGRAGDHVIITMVDPSGAELLDPSLSLQMADGREIAANDDVGDIHPDGMTSRDARIDFILPGDGLFIIEAGRFGGRGDYILTLESVSS